MFQISKCNDDEDEDQIFFQFHHPIPQIKERIKIDGLWYKILSELQVWEYYGGGGETSTYSTPPAPNTSGKGNVK